MTSATGKSISGACCLASMFLLASCSGNQVPVADSLAAPGVLRCAEISVYGIVRAVDTTGSSPSVQFSANRWVIPKSGESSISFNIDAADMTWEVGDVGLLVLKEGTSPLLLNPSQADEVEESWDGVNKPASEDCNSS